MKTLKIFTTAFFTAFTFAVSAQINQTPLHTGNRQIVTKNKVSDPATGSQFVTEAYMPAQTEGKTEKIMLRYNAYDDTFESQDPYTKDISIHPKVANEKIVFTGSKKTYIYTNYTTEKGEKISGYLHLIAEGPGAMIYKRERIALIPEKHPANSYESYKPANYKRTSDEYYIAINEGQDAVTLPDNKKEFAKLFPGKDKAVLDYIKENKIDLEKDQDLMKLGTYLKSI